MSTIYGTWIPIEGEVTQKDKDRFFAKITIIQNGKRNGCWRWDAALNKSRDKTIKDRFGNYFPGYGIFYFNGRLLRAHRFALYMQEGIDPGPSVDHLCHYTRCVNPDHLRGCTVFENNRQRLPVIAEYCINGHLRKEPNGYYRGDGGPGTLWICRICRQDWERAHKDQRYQRDKLKQTHDSTMRDFARDPKLNEEIVKEIRTLYTTEIKSQRKLATKFQVSQPMIGFIVRNESWYDENYIPGVGYKDG